MNYKETKTVTIVTLFLLMAVFPLLLACGGNNNNQKNNNDAPNPFEDKTRLENINRYLTEKDKDVIESFIRRQGWKMTFAPEGYYYEVYDEGTSPKAKQGSEVELDYSISLLDGEVLSAPTEPKIFKVERSHEISGLHQGVQLLGKGGRAKFIFPPLLAYGLVGDRDKIPPRSIVIYDVKIIDIR